MNISICIPTYKRAGYLREVLLSIISANIQPVEVIIGDNSGGDVDTANIIICFASLLPIKHVLHNPPLNYGGNLEYILTLAQGDWIGVMHDDDFYLPGAGNLFRSALQESQFDFFFSDHLICKSNGIILKNKSQENSEKYNRSLLKRGYVQDPLKAVLLSQVCMDGWFARRELVKSVHIDPRWSEYIDTQYLVQFATNSQSWFYEHKSTFVYRLSDNSLTASGILVQELFDYYSNLYLVKKEHMNLRDLILTNYAPVAVTRWLMLGQKGKARECLLSKYYAFPNSIRGLIKYILQVIWVHSPNFKK